ncbi:uncharacterized protein SPAPADRAFT_67769 [Spathaspora passalidarum NRRL Y-27907]|uniref:Hyphally-regulated cell wall protein N-terminal domain-containing protein n=1 Tax=Spathaspora passalidarum (strain NRRL Y-27907 / 11-Y1) TaxID=619300 RepID=G3ARD7_SPAPN|nr:uncharacterized protein SPAPADRAFT_67769 [Spathaspora passalidarum NRRL Y-27907]EGW31744.1 hypothetical protein SPAPADRAFT_67769 [Spathaspora passalidarum NRRL Y-27907]
MTTLATFIVCLFVQAIATQAATPISIEIQVTGTDTMETRNLSASVDVESGGILTLLNVANLDIFDFIVKDLGQFFYKTNIEPAVKIQNLNNSGYILFDTSDVESGSIKAWSDNRNDGELVIYGQSLNVRMGSIENTGSITFWGQEGSVYLDSVVNNTKDMCFHEQVVKLSWPTGAGCYAFLNSTVIISRSPEYFSPTFVLEGSNNHIYLESTFNDLTIHIVNFENVKYITIHDTYRTFSYSNGSLILDFLGKNLTLDIGSGYDKKGITVEKDTDKRNTHISYNGTTPSNGTKRAECACSFVPPVKEATSPTPVSEAESTSSNNDDKGEGNQNSKNSSLTTAMPIYFCLLSLAISYMIM